MSKLKCFNLTHYRLVIASLMVGTFLIYRFFSSAMINPGTVLLLLNAQADAKSFFFWRHEPRFLYFWHSGHILNDFTAFLVFQTWKLLGWHDGALVPLQTANAFFGCLAVGLFFILVFRLIGNVVISAFTAILFAFSYSFWFFCSELKMYPLSAVLFLFCILKFLDSFEKGTLKNYFYTGIVGGISILCHLANFILVPAIVLLTSILEKGWKKKLIAAFYFAMPACLIPLLFYRIVYQTFDIPSLFEIRGGWYASDGLVIYRGLLSGGQFLLGELNTSKQFSAISQMIPGIFSMIGLIFLLVSIANILKKKRGYFIIAFILAGLVFTGFYFFQPYCSYIFILMIPLLMLFAMAVESTWEILYPHIGKKVASTTLYIIFTIMVAVLFFANFRDQIYPDHLWENNRLYSSVTFDKSYIEPHDIMLVRSEEEYYYLYFLKCQVLRLPLPDNKEDPIEIKKTLLKSLEKGQRVFFHESQDIPYISFEPPSRKAAYSFFKENSFLLQKVARMDKNNVLYRILRSGSHD